MRDTAERTRSALGLSLVERGPTCWNDYSDIDVVLGLRAFGRSSFDTKPATKMVNAWLAGAPFIGGRDSAFSQIASPGKEYLVAYSPETLREALATLIKDRSYYENLRKAGIEKGREFTAPAVTQAWVQILNFVIDNS